MLSSTLRHVASVSRRRAAAPRALASPLLTTAVTPLHAHVPAASFASSSTSLWGRPLVATSRIVGMKQNVRNATTKVAVTPATSTITTKPTGAVGTKEWRLFFFQGDKKISPWHDIALYPQGSGPKDILVTYVNEIPRGTRPKLEIATKEEGNPIKQDIKKGNLRLFTYGDIPFNYGALPQTWEDPSHVHKDTQCVGDNDPLDVVEVSSTPLPIGAVVTVRVLGLLGLIDEGETDWKIIAINVADPLAQTLLDSDDLETFHPHVVSTIRDWFKNYKTTDGKAVNRFAFDEKMRSQAYAMRVVDECYHNWQKLLKGRTTDKELVVKRFTA